MYSCKVASNEKLVVKVSLKLPDYINYQKFRMFAMSDKVLYEIFCVRNLNASEIFRDLIVLLRYLSKPISYLLDKDILTSSLLSNSPFASS